MIFASFGNLKQIKIKFETGLVLGSTRGSTWLACTASGGSALRAVRFKGHQTAVIYRTASD
jgi:hypothetical protein